GRGRERPAPGDVIADREPLEAAEVRGPAGGSASRDAATTRPAHRRDERADRVERVVRRLARPHQIPERVTELRGEAAAGGGEELREERRAAGCEDLAQAIVDGSVGPRLGRRSEQREMLREEQRDLAVAWPERAPAHPHELARCQ